MENRPPKWESFMDISTVDDFLKLYDQQGGVHVRFECFSKEGKQTEVIDTTIQRAFNRDGRLGKTLNALIVKAFVHGWEISVSVEDQIYFSQRRLNEKRFVEQVKQICEEWAREGAINSTKAMDKISDSLIEKEL